MILNGFSGITCKGFWDQKIDKIKFQMDVYIIYSSEVCATTKLKLGTNKLSALVLYKVTRLLYSSLNLLSSTASIHSILNSNPEARRRRVGSKRVVEVVVAV